MTQNVARKNTMQTFYIIWFGQLISTIGSGLTGFALGVGIYQETGSVTSFALFIFSFMLPGVLLSPIAGALADRWPRRWVMILSDSGAGLSTSAIWLLLATGNLETWHIYIATLFNAAFTTFQWPAYSAATTMLVSKENLGRASGMVQIGEAISQLFSPAIAGALFVTIGVEGVVLIDVATFLFAVLTLLAVRIPEPERSIEGEESKESFRSEITFGWKYITARKGLLALLLYFATLNFASGMIGPLMQPLILDQVEPDIMGYVFSFIGLGMLAGTVVMSVWGGPKRRIYGILVPAFLESILLMILGFNVNVIAFAAGGFFFLFGMPILNGSSQALWQSKTAPDVQGRVFSVRRMIAQFTSPIAILLAGPLAEKVFQPMVNEGGVLASTFLGQLVGVGPGRGTGLLFVFLGVFMVIATIIAYLHPRLRLVEDELPDVEVRERVEEETLAAEPASSD
jgi:DHA3 family macrolide efflux protein-like MFS transporter